MYLKALEIQGFKSFPDKTRLTFEKNVTAIVGPNGSGKSNISDALLWVMGEQRSRALRGGRMEDVIFGGTEKRSALGYAQVTLFLDNSGGLFPIDAQELSISRRYYRSGESEYFINRESVRLRDINELLMDTGLGRDGYSIIGQGRIAEIVSAKSTDRRDIFEEAAGISRFRYRKEESERKLAATDESLLRVGDKIDELQLQLDPLRTQAEKAKKYLLLRDELRGMEISLWMEQLDRLSHSMQTVKTSLEKAEAALEKARADLQRSYEKNESLSARMHEKDIEAESMRTRLSLAESAIADNESAAAVLRTERANNLDSIEHVRGDIASDNDRIRALDAQIELYDARLRTLSEAAQSTAQSISSLSNIVNGHRMKMSGREKRAADLRDQVLRLTADSRAAESRLELLGEMKRDYEGFSNAIRQVMREASHGTLRGVHGPVADLIRAPERLALAVETALGYAAQNIVVSTRDDGRAAVEWLKRHNAGRATFLPMDAIRGQLSSDLPKRAKGYLGLAYDLVSFDKQYDSIVRSLLGRTIITETLSDAIAIARAGGDRLRIVSLDGQMINPGGSMTGGSAARGTGALTRANELERLQAQQGERAERLSALRETLDAAERELAAARFDMQAASDELATAQSQAASQEAESSSVRTAADQLRDLRSAMVSGGGERQALIDSYTRRNEQIDSELEANALRGAELSERAAACRARLSEISTGRFDLEADRTETEKQIRRGNEEVIDREREVADVQRRVLSAEMEEKQLLDRLWDTYELSRSAALELRQPVESLSAAQKAVSDLKRRMNALGTPNLGAIDEFERVSERYEFLSGQRDDIVKAKNELLSIIGDITQQMTDIFLTEFERIGESFRSTFLELFGGGRALLRLEDEKEPLTCGIEIRVQPPGKAVSNISLLSGGEKAFVAIALYFAILRVRPTPFCVMDEIEAALDEENVARFADYMRVLGDKTQFLTITHRRGTMERADVLYGVTMQEKGVSRIVTLDLAEAEKTITN